MKENSLVLEIYADYLCPWSYIANLSINELILEYKNKINVYWRSFLLKEKKSNISIKIKDRIQEYIIKNWARAKLNEPRALFNISNNIDFPDYSMPAHIAAKCVRIQGEEYFFNYHNLLYLSLFQHNLNISKQDVLIELAKKLKLDIDKFINDYNNSETIEIIKNEYNEAINRNIKCIPTTIINNENIITGAISIKDYKEKIKTYLLIFQ